MEGEPHMYSENNAGLDLDDLIFDEQDGGPSER